MVKEEESLMKSKVSCLAIGLFAFLTISASALQEGPPVLDFVGELGHGTLQMNWHTDCRPPALFLAFAYDIYLGEWAQAKGTKNIFFTFLPCCQEGEVALENTGAYHVWNSSLYPDGQWCICENPWTGILFGGTPHAPLNFTVAQGEAEQDDTLIENREILLGWKPDIFGASVVQIIAYQVGVGWVQTRGADGYGLWHTLSYGAMGEGHIGNFFKGCANLQVDSQGEFWVFMRTMGWDGQSASEFVQAYVNVE